LTAPDTVVLDLDGTLVDSVYAHTVAWQSAFRDVGVLVPTARIHRLIGMGGDRLVTEAAGQGLEQSLGDQVRERHQVRLDELFDRIVPTDGAEDLLAALERHRFQVVLASSADAELTERLLSLVEGASRLTANITGSHAETSKPSGELVEVALSHVDTERAVLVGDAVWDVRAAQDAGVPCIGLLTGGISEAELTEAGAVAVHASPAALVSHLEEHGTLT
jgi:HAD superfamily hydrolase (TIGR01549 family)